MSRPKDFTPPVQSRSEQTLKRMVDSAREALETKSLDELTLQELTAGAGVTVGAFYQRFPSKAAFLKYLEDEAYQEIQNSSAALFQSPSPGTERTVQAHVRAFVSGMASLYHEHRGVLRALVQRSRDSRARQQRRMDMTQDVVGRAVDWILAQGGTVGHPEPRKALGVALLFTSSALRDVILFEESWAGLGADSDVETLVEELVRAADAYLGVPVE